MRTELERLCRGFQFDWRLHKQPVAILAILLLLLYLISIVTGQADKPRVVSYYAEMGMFPLVIMFTTMMFQHEIGGGGMEIIATYPVSLRLIAWRKWLSAVLLSLLASLIWMSVYLYKYGMIRTKFYPWNGGEAVFRSGGILELLLQALPAYLLLASLTLVGIIVFRSIYGGLLSGFSIWILDTISGGRLLASFTLYTAYLPREASFPLNRVTMLLVSVLLLGLALWLIGYRERWIGREEE
ncbi:hypothetical protein [Paenibacillus aceti]|uniref:ABC transporter permease n=1 Tax=Paenibacillus aceti TaxID=1820010 RepID=A0ABQ1W523_9BACL|nr:hypothetical protein [Paenibacillus aceti]GGG14583.1 hypothetical protein GCM10010913_40530 [Paenibacillus aceti]